MPSMSNGLVIFSRGKSAGHVSFVPRQVDQVDRSHAGNGDVDPSSRTLRVRLSWWACRPPRPFLIYSTIPPPSLHYPQPPGNEPPSRWAMTGHDRPRPRTLIDVLGMMDADIAGTYRSELSTTATALPAQPPDGNCSSTSQTFDSVDADVPFRRPRPGKMR
jgi:hypothetical protein